MVCGELTRWRIFGEWVFGNCHVGESLSESLANGLWRTDTLATLWPIFGECLANGIWGTDTLANLWPLFGESLANLWRMAFGELTRWRIFGESFANSFWGSDTSANL